MTPSYLFVYGSLTSASGHPMGGRLRREARLVGEGTIAGRLYRVSWYPAAVDSSEPKRRVHGEVYVLARPAATLAWLDAYEGTGPGRAGASEYARVARPVRLAAGGEVTAWVYLYRKGAAHLQAIPDGRWRPRHP